ncbi:putative cytochrome P450 [Aureobasidium namibiae CBS 147.97]|uniref:Putative cytochrome P450 n=1 Tax=Aureobasidium namibiae CBS 147.97 TaxID=1043004 RepID=A0A074WZE4_9PEZI
MDASQSLIARLSDVKWWSECFAKGLDIISILSVGFLLASLYISCHMVYNLYFHPLASFPGPFWARSSLLWRIYHSSGGRFHRRIYEQHKIHGSVFRVSPNELSFAGVNSWKAIYGHPAAGQATMIKAEFYDIYGSGFKSLCIGSERKPEKHSRMRKSLSAAFSTKALIEQEQIINGCVDAFVDRLGDGTSDNGINMTKWFEMVAFDILGEMAFGESFGCIDSGKPHFWSELIEEHLFFITVVDNLRRYPFFVTLGRWILPLTASLRDKHTGLSREKVAKRLSISEPRKDFMSHLIKKVQNGEMDREELTAHASTLVIAGGETVSTFLAASTFYLLKNPQHLRRLQTEIRGKFRSYGDIDATRAQQMPFLQAVISEGLRIYPPGSRGFPRVSTGGTIDGHYVPPGVDVYTSAWTVTHDEAYFKNPFTFDPERWLDPMSEEVKEASQPFSLGTRGCLGRNLILAKMHWRYDIALVNETLQWEEQSREHVMWTKPELFVRFQEHMSR